MCGLLFSLRLVASTLPTDDPDFAALLAAVTPRGPDSLKVHVSHIALPDGQTVELKLAASVLGLRGQGVTVQPVEDDSAVFGWNGQVFQGMDIGLDENDTSKLFERLRHEQTEDVLASIEGPYACIYVDKTSRTVHFRIDPLSRRSLLVRHTDQPTDRFVLCSTRSPSIDVDIPLRAMDGGEGGVIQLDQIQVEDGLLDLSSALKASNSLSKESPWTCVAPINTSLPPASPPSPSSEVSTFIANLTASVRRRVENIPPVPSQSRLAILFSGGVDCSLVAALAHRCLSVDEPIDLINVAFQRSPAASQANEADYAVPDRISGLEATEELRQCCPGREWRFVEINVPFEECMAHRQRVVDLMYPNETEMDLSLAFPLYFASRGVGTAQTATDGTRLPYTVKAKVFLSGLGADEQLAGYSRHKHAFRTGSWPGLISELQLDITRLPTRNLSRDDRIISSHARDARFPYLDLTFIAYLSSLPVWLKCDPTMEGGDKLLLRLAAKELGLARTSGRVKRAMQFGTRSAKVGGAGRGAKKGGLAIQSL